MFSVSALRLQYYSAHHYDLFTRHNYKCTDVTQETKILVTFPFVTGHTVPVLTAEYHIRA